MKSRFLLHQLAAALTTFSITLAQPPLAGAGVEHTGIDPTAILTARLGGAFPGAFGSGSFSPNGIEHGIGFGAGPNSNLPPVLVAPHSVATPISNVALSTDITPIVNVAPTTPIPRIVPYDSPYPVSVGYPVPVPFGVSYPWDYDKSLYWGSVGVLSSCGSSFSGSWC